MPVMGLDHINVRTPDMAGTVAFFRDALAMTVTPSPNASNTDRGAWVLDASGVAMLHISANDVPFPSDDVRPFTPTSGSGAIHHVALRCAGYSEVRQRLEAMGIAFRENYIPQIDLHQIFVADPSDILIELNFSGA
jgi:catechol 2,3-dioxygenase-like lactoylglutathione lyase family enzyme